MQKQLEVEGVVFLINTVESDIEGEESVHEIGLAVRKGEKVLGLMHKTFPEVGFYWGVDTLLGGLYPDPLGYTHSPNVQGSRN